MINLNSSNEQLQKDIAAFKNMERWWKGGYYEGNPLDPIGISNYGKIGFMSVLHATYLACIKPFVNENTVVLEIGPGRGAWTKTFLHAKEIWCLDALSAENNNFWNYVGRAPNIKYFQVSDFSCRMLPENAIDYLFSFGCFCHVSFAGISEYMKNLYPKLRNGAHGFIMVADFQKYNASLEHIGAFDITGILKNVFLGIKGYKSIRLAYNLLHKLSSGPASMPGKGRQLDISEEYNARLKWYNAGVERTCDMLRSHGYTVIDPDMGVNHRDPVIHFHKR